MASPLDKETIEYCDRYLKATIRNIRCDHFVHLVKPSKYNLTFVNLDQFENELASEKTEPENSLCEYIDVPGAQIPIHDPEIYHALMSLSPMQRSILLQNIILKLRKRFIFQMKSSFLALPEWRIYCAFTLPILTAALRWPFSITAISITPVSIMISDRKSSVVCWMP